MSLINFATPILILMLNGKRGAEREWEREGVRKRDRQWQPLEIIADRSFRLVI